MGKYHVLSFHFLYTFQPSISSLLLCTLAEEANAEMGSPPASSDLMTAFIGVVFALIDQACSSIHHFAPSASRSICSQGRSSEGGVYMQGMRFSRKGCSLFAGGILPLVPVIAMFSAYQFHTLLCPDSLERSEAAHTSRLLSILHLLSPVTYLTRFLVMGRDKRHNSCLREMGMAYKLCLTPLIPLLIPISTPSNSKCGFLATSCVPAWPLVVPWYLLYRTLVRKTSDLLSNAMVSNILSLSMQRPVLRWNSSRIRESVKPLRV